MIDFAEKRGFIRMPMRCPIRRKTADERHHDRAELWNLGASGADFVIRQAHETGEPLRAMVTPDDPITPPLEAEVSVVRCAEIDGGFGIAATIDLVGPALYPDDD